MLWIYKFKKAANSQEKNRHAHSEQGFNSRHKLIKKWQARVYQMLW